MKKPRVMDVEIMKKFFTGVTWYLIAHHLSLLFAFTVLFRLENTKPLSWAGSLVMMALVLAGLFGIMYKRVAEPLKEINKAAWAMSCGNLEFT